MTDIFASVRSRTCTMQDTPTRFSVFRGRVSSPSARHSEVNLTGLAWRCVMRSVDPRALVVAALLAACVVVTLPPAAAAQTAAPAVRSGQWVFVPEAAMLGTTAQAVVPSGSGASGAGAAAAP